MRLAGKLQETEPTVHRTAVWQEDGIVNIVNDRNAGAAQSGLYQLRPNQRNLATDE